jgi:hypothetical protein
MTIEITGSKTAEELGEILNGESLSPENKAFVEAFETDTTLKEISTEYTAQFGTNSIKLGPNSKMAYCGRFFQINHGDTIYTIPTAPVGRRTAPEYFRGRYLATKSLQTDYSETIDATNGVSQQYTATDTEIVYETRIWPLSAGHLTYKVVDDNTGQTLFNVIKEVTDENLGSYFSITSDVLYLDDGQAITVTIGGISVGGLNGEPYLVVKAYTGYIVSSDVTPACCIQSAAARSLPTDTWGNIFYQTSETFQSNDPAVIAWDSSYDAIYCNKAGLYEATIKIPVNPAYTEANYYVKLDAITASGVISETLEQVKYYKGGTGEPLCIGFTWTGYMNGSNRLAFKVMQDSGSTRQFSNTADEGWVRASVKYLGPVVE